METLLSYLLKGNAVLTLLFGTYWLLLRKEKFLAVNRFLLLGIIAAIIILPLCPGFNYEGPGNKHIFLNVLNTPPRLYTNMSHPGAGARYAPGPVLFENTQSRIDPTWVIVIPLYILVALVLFTRLSIHLSRIFMAIRHSSKQKIKGAVFCEPAEDTPPFSFFKFIVIRRNAFEAERYRQIVSHELCHCRQLHSIDVLLAEAACIFLWMNPLVYLLRRRIKLNLEFIADEEALCSGVDRRNYQLNLLSTAGKVPAYLLANSFHSTRIGQRITMINTERPPFCKVYKYAILIPLVAVLYIFVNAQRAESTEQSLSAAEPGKYKSAKSNSTQAIADRTKKPEEGGGIYIDARTDTVRFSEIAEGEKNAKNDKGFKGIYVIEGNVFSEKEIRDILKPSGKFDFLLAGKPMIGFYTENDEYAVRTWGKQARKGVFFIDSRKSAATVDHQTGY